jgi:predicted XRE-type DNA-binding protein
MSENMKNLQIREAAAQARIKFWEIAAALGVNDSTLSRWLRVELSDDEQERILTIIRDIKEKEGDES